MTWVAQVIGHDVPSPKLPDFLGIGHIKPKVCPDIRIGICSLKLYLLSETVCGYLGKLLPFYD